MPWILQILIFILSIVIGTKEVQANTVSFKDGYGITPTYTPDWSDLQLNYSVKSQLSIRVSSFYHPTPNFGELR